MKAIVVKTYDDGLVTVRARLSAAQREFWYLMGHHLDLRIGDTVEVEKRANSPYLHRCPKQTRDDTNYPEMP